MPAIGARRSRWLCRKVLCTPRHVSHKCAPRSSRLFTLVAFKLVAALALAQAVTGGLERDLVARRARIGVQRLESDGGHGSVEAAESDGGHGVVEAGEGPSISAATPTTAGTDSPQTSATSPALVRVTWLPTATYVWLPLLEPTSVGSAVRPPDCSRPRAALGLVRHPFALNCTSSRRACA